MPFDLPPFDETRTLLLASASGRFPNKNLNQRAGLYKFLSVIALALTDSNHNLSQVQLDVMADTAEGIFLRRHANIYGVIPKGAVGGAASSGYRVFGDAAAAVPALESLVQPSSGLLFQTTSGGVIPAGGFLDVDIAAVSTGEATNLEIGQELQFSATPPDLEATGRVVVELLNGIDDELEDALRARLLNRIGQPAAGGNRNDYDQFVLQAAAFVKTAYTYPNRNGLGTVDLAALKAGSGSVRALTLAERDVVEAVVEVLRPVSATIRMLETTTLAQDVEITVTPENDPAFVRDWDDSTPPVVLTWTPATRVLLFDAARPGNMGIGDRLIVEAAVGSTGIQRTIEALSGTDGVVLDAIPTETPTPLDVVYSGGPIIKAIRDAVVAHFDSLGPSNPLAANYGPWEGTLRLSSLFEIAQLSTGVLDSAILDPVANVEPADPAFPLNTTVEYLIPGEILIRYA